MGEMSQKQIGSNMLVRRYLPKDLDAVKFLIHNFADSFNDTFNENFFKSSMKMRLLDPSIATFVCEHNNHLCGCAFADLERDPRGVLFGRISNVNIRESCQGLGIGSALVDEAVDFLSTISVPWIWANVNPRNDKMMRMFERRDFSKMLKVMELTLDPFSPVPQVDLIRNATRYRSIIENDIPQVKMLVKELAELFNEPFDPFWFDLSIEKYFQVPSSKIFVATKEGEILGVAFAEVQRNPYGNTTGYISNIMIKSKARGQGIGTHLLELTTAFLQNLNMSKIWANVNHDNLAMEKMFEARGYKHKFTVMVKKLEPGGAC